MELWLKRRRRSRRLGKERGDKNYPTNIRLGNKNSLYNLQIIKEWKITVIVIIKTIYHYDFYHYSFPITIITHSRDCKDGALWNGSRAVSL